MLNYVAIVGPGAEATPEDLADAHRAGSLLAGHGVVVITGGLGGVMAAAARGVKEGNGVSIGLLPGRERSQGYPEHTYLLATGVGEQRNALIVRTADVVLSIGGSWGTLSEVALAVRTGKPVVAIRSWDLPGDLIHEVANADEAVEVVLKSIENQF